MCICVFLCMYIDMHVFGCPEQRPEEGVRRSRTRFYPVVSHPVWVQNPGLLKSSKCKKPLSPLSGPWVAVCFQRRKTKTQTMSLPVYSEKITFSQRKAWPLLILRINSWNDLLAKNKTKKAKTNKQKTKNLEVFI